MHPHCNRLPDWLFQNDQHHFPNEINFINNIIRLQNMDIFNLHVSGDLERQAVVADYTLELGDRVGIVVFCWSNEPEKCGKFFLLIREKKNVVK